MCSFVKMKVQKHLSSIEPCLGTWNFSCIVISYSGKPCLFTSFVCFFLSRTAVVPENPDFFKLQRILNPDLEVPQARFLYRVHHGFFI